MKNLWYVLVCIITMNAYAQQKKDTTKTKRINLSEVIVTGKLSSNSINTSIKNDYLKKIVQPKNVTDLFTGINGFSVIKRGNYAIDPIFRAAAYEQLNVMYDGGTKAVHACPNRMDPITTHILPEEITKIEVIKGPYTVRYGATFGGIVNMVSENYNHLENGFSGKISLGHESNGNAFISLVQLQHVSDQFDIIGNIGYRNFDDYQDGEGVKIPSAFKSTDYGIRIGYNITENQRLQAHWRQSFGRDVKHAALPMDTDFDNSSVLSLDYKAEEVGAKLKTVTVKGYFSYVDHLMTNENRPNFSMVFASSPVTSTTLGGKVELHYLLNENLNLYVGVDESSIKREGNRTRTIKMMNGNMLMPPMVVVDKIWQDASLNDLGLFTEAKYNLSDKTLLTTGVRLDFVTANATDPEADFIARYSDLKHNETNFSGTVSVKHKVSNGFTLETAFGRGVRTANMIERYINHFTVGSDSYEYLGNPYLKPEVNNQFEVGALGTIQFNKNTRLNYQSSVYYSILENYIVGVVNTSIPRKFMPMSMPQYTKVFTNIKKAYKTGFELGLKLDIHDYFIKSDMSYVYTKNNDFGESLPLNPPFTTLFSAGLEKDQYWATMIYTLVSKQDHIAPSFGETITKGYQTLDLKLGFKLSKSSTLGLACLNIFDKIYTNHLNFAYRNQFDLPMSSITEPGRNLTAFLQYKF